MLTSVSTRMIVEQRAKGWPDFHPEDYCHQCGRPNIHSWYSPEWVQLAGDHAGILCPVCFAALDPSAIWKVTRHIEPGTDRVQGLAALLRVVSEDSEPERVARCILDYLA